MCQDLVYSTVRDLATCVGQVKVKTNKCLRTTGEGRVNVQIHKADPEVAHLGDHLPAGLQLPIPGRLCLLPGSSQPTQLRAAQMPLSGARSPARESGPAESSHLPHPQQEDWRWRQQRLQTFSLVISFDLNNHR